MVKPTLLVLAAGMGSRYGSLKQMDGVGPNGEAIIDYSVYDAIRAGFGKVVFVIRHSFAEEFAEVFNAERFGGKIAVEYVFQELDNLPELVAFANKLEEACIDTLNDGIMTKDLVGLVSEDFKATAVNTATFIKAIRERLEAKIG